jgi:large subunit ribosomal protein L4
VLIVIAEAEPHLEISARNLPRVAVVRVAGLNVYDVLRHERLLIERGALDALGARLGAAGDAA